MLRLRSPPSLPPERRASSTPTRTRGTSSCSASGQIGLIDYGQVKQISGRARSTLASVMLALASRTKAPPHAPSGTPAELAEISRLCRSAPSSCLARRRRSPAAVAMWLFDDASEELPGGFEQNELSPKSPVTSLAGFPQDLVLVARAAVLIKGIAAKLELDWSLAERWAPLAQPSADRERAQAAQDAGGRVRFRAVLGLARAWAVGRLRRGRVRVHRAEEQALQKGERHPRPPVRRQTPHLPERACVPPTCRAGASDVPPGLANSWQPQVRMLTVK